MTEKRFVYIEHKGADYILDSPNYDLDYIEMLGDTLESKEIVDLLNTQHEQIQHLESRIKDYDVALKSLQDLIDRKLKENEQLKKELDCFKPLIFETDEMPITLYEKKDGGDVE